MSENKLKNEEKFKACVKTMLELLGEDPARLPSTPQKFLEALTFLTSGTGRGAEGIFEGALFPIATGSGGEAGEADGGAVLGEAGGRVVGTAANEAANETTGQAVHEAVIVRDLPFFSLCEHHLLPFFGRISLGYLPAGHLIGLGRIPRLIELYSRRLSLQERLGERLAQALITQARTAGAGVLIRARHFCAQLRGGSGIVESLALRGVFAQEGPARRDFLARIYAGGGGVGGGAGEFGGAGFGGGWLG